MCNSHFRICRFFKFCRYSFRNLFQMRFDQTCVCQKSFRWWTNFSAYGKHGRHTFWLPRRKCFGAIASKSFTSELIGVNGLAFNVCSTRQIVVEITSSVTDQFTNSAYIAFLQLLTSRSRTPPKCGAAGRLNFHLMPRWTKYSSIFSRFDAAIYSLNSRTAPTKIVTFSLIIVIDLPLCAINRITALRQMSVSNFGTTSICTARTVGHVNKQHQRFSVPATNFYSKGQIILLQRLQKVLKHPACLLVALPSLEPLYVLCFYVFYVFIERKAFLNFIIIQNRCWTMLLRCSVSSWSLSLCSLRKNNSTTWFFKYNNMGCFALKYNWFFPFRHD